MPPKENSRFIFTFGQEDEGEVRSQPVQFTTDRIRFKYRIRPDNINHPVSEGDTLFTLAGRYFRGIDRPSGLWWVIGDYQPDPVHDPTIQLPLATSVVVPSLRTVLEEVFNLERADEEES